MSNPTYLNRFLHRLNQLVPEMACVVARLSPTTVSGLLSCRFQQQSSVYKIKQTVQIGKQTVQIDRQPTQIYKQTVQINKQTVQIDRQAVQIDKQTVQIDK